MSSQRERRLARAYARSSPILLAGLLGCAGSVGDDVSGATGRESGVEHRGQDVVGGTPSGADQNSVVLVIREGFDSWGTGVVVSPTLVMTSRHLLYEAQVGENNVALCPEQGGTTPILRAYDPTTLRVVVGNARPLPSQTALGVNSFSGNDLDLCDNDIALLEVDTPLPVAPLPIRLDEPPRVGEEGTLVGWGANQEDLQSMAYRFLTDARQQRDLSVLAVGPTIYTPPGSTERALEAAVFMATEGGCVGDSGAPLISKETGAIIGIQTAIQNSDPVIGLDVADAPLECLGAFTIFQRIDMQKDWIRSAFRETGSAPWLENARQPAPFGSPCSTESDCISGICVSAGQTTFCSERCERGACPGGSVCVGEASARLCSIDAIAGDAVKDGCGLVAVPRRRAPLVSLAFIAVAWARRRCRRAVRYRRIL